MVALSTFGRNQQVNVGDGERWVSALGGGALALCGMRHGGAGGIALALAGGALIYRGVSGHCPARAAMRINRAEAASPEQYFESGIHVEQAVTINRTPWDLYEFWKNLENLPRFMDHLHSVRKIDERRSHWTARAPLGMKVEWDAEIINDEPNALIAWRSLAGATVDNAGSVRFVPGPEGRGTEVRVVLDYIPPAGRIGKLFAQLFGEEPSQQIRDDLRHFKQLMEAGELPTTEGQTSGRA